MSDSIVVLVTSPTSEKAAEIARALVGERLAACVNVVPGIRSIYRWKGAVCEEGEVLLVIKTLAERFDSLRERVLALHGYECPEVIALPVTCGHAPYLAWIAENVS